MTTEAIQKTDVSEGQKEPAEQPVMTKRDMDYMALVEKRERERLAESGQPAEEVKEEEAPEEEIPDEVAEQEIPMVEFIGADGNPIKIPATAKFRAKVDGKEEELTVENMTRSYQKGVAADERLEESTRMMRVAEAKAAEIAARESALTAQEKTLADRMAQIEQRRDEGTLSEDGYKKMAEDLLNALTNTEVDSTVDSLASVLKNLVPQQKAQSPVDREALLQEAEQRIERKLSAKEQERAYQEAEKKRTSANNWFREKYQDIVSDPMWLGAAKSVASKLWEETPDADPMKIADEVGKQVSERIKGLSAQGRPKPAPAPTPKAVSARALVGKEEKVETRKDILNQMRATRGQPPL